MNFWSYSQLRNAPIELKISQAFGDRLDLERRKAELIQQLEGLESAYSLNQQDIGNLDRELDELMYRLQRLYRATAKHGMPGVQKSARETLLLLEPQKLSLFNKIDNLNAESRRLQIEIQRIREELTKIDTLLLQL